MSVYLDNASIPAPPQDARHKGADVSEVERLADLFTDWLVDQGYNPMDAAELVAEMRYAAKGETRPPRPCEEKYAKQADRPRDKDGWPKRWSDPTYLGDGPWGA